MARNQHVLTFVMTFALCFMMGKVHGCEPFLKMQGWTQLWPHPRALILGLHLTMGLDPTH
jgi:hypothetical protein